MRFTRIQIKKNHFFRVNTVLTLFLFTLCLTSICISTNNLSHLNQDDVVLTKTNHFSDYTKEDLCVLDDQTSPIENDVNLLESNENGIKIEVCISDIFVENLVADDGETYQKMSITDGGHISDIGHPELPTKGIYLELPSGVQPELQITESVFYEECGYNIFPAQEIPLDIQDNDANLKFSKNLTVYQLNTYFPSDVVSIHDIGIIRGHHTGLIIIRPVQFNPLLQKIRVYTKIIIELNYPNSESLDIDNNEKQRLSNRLDSSSFQSFFGNLYLNYEYPINTLEDTDSNSNGADYLIITPEQFCDNLIPFVNSKENQGLTTKVANFTETGSTVSGIETYIQNAYDTWDIPPTYLLLVGDSNLLPTKYSPYNEAGTLPTDLYYATVDGEDFFPDLLYGRLPVRTDVELDSVIAKNLNWVNNFNPADAWRQKILLSAYDQAGRYFVDTSESIRTFLEGEGYTCNTVYAPDGAPVAQDTTDIINYINAGTFFVNHRDHGIADGWQRPEFYTSHVSSLSNVDNYPVVFSVDCQTGHFDETADSLAETILKANNKGAVAYIGATRSSWSGFNDELNRGLIAAIWPDYFSSYTNRYGHSSELGTVLNFGKMFMFDKYVLTGGVGSEGTVYPWGSILYPAKTKNTFELFHIFGDPHLSLIESDAPSEPYNPKPSDESTGISTNAQLSVDAFDPNGDIMNVSFYNALDDSLIGTVNNVSNRRTSSIFWSGLSRDTTYTWYANVTDGIYTLQSPVWDFTTRADSEYSRSPIIINEINSGAPDAIELYNFGPDRDMTGWYVECYAGENLYSTYYFPLGWIFRSNYVATIYESTGTNSDTALYTGGNLNFGNFRFAVGLYNKETTNQDWFQTSDFVLTPPYSVGWIQDAPLLTTSDYAYRINDYDTDRASDWAISASGSIGSLNPGQSGTWNAPNAPSNPNPVNDDTNVSPDPTLSVDVVDVDGDPMDVSFYDTSNNHLIGTDLGVSSGGTASITWSGLLGGTLYSWYAIADDTWMNTISPTWSFTTIGSDPPTWDSTPTDQVVEFGDPFSYDVDASDSSGIDHYWVNDTTNFQIDSNGLITNAISLSIGEYWIEIRAYDPGSLYCSAIIKVTVEDTTTPTWDSTPTDQVVEYGDPFSYDVDASDLSGIDHYWVDDTINFQIDSNGLITNAISLSVGEYWIEIRAYDPGSLYCSATIKVTVEDTTTPTWDSTPTDQVLELGDPFSYDVDASDLSGIDHYWVNDTTNFQVDSNGLITNAVSLSVGEYWIEIRAYDPGNFYCSATIKITVEDTTAPTWDFAPTDHVIEYGDPFSYDVNASDPSGIDHYWINDTTNFQIDSNGLITNVVSLSVGEYWIEIRAYNPGSFYCSATIKIVNEDTTDPTWDSTPTDQVVECGDPVACGVDASDLSGIDHYWINDTTNFQIESNGNIYSVVTLSVGEYGIEVRAYDPYNNYCTYTIKATVEDTTPPTWYSTPTDQVVEYGDQFAYGVGAEDLSLIDNFWVNDTTNFQIDNTGLIINVVPLSVGEYWIELRAYDPYGNYCSATIKITVEDSAPSVPPPPGIPSFNLLVMIGIIAAFIILFIKKYNRFYKKSK